MKTRAVNLWLIAVNVAASLAVIAVALKLLAAPILAGYIYKERYKELVFECDDVMRGHFIAKAQAAIAPSEDAIKNLRAAEVSLTTCHDYDKLRKKLQLFGLSDAQLADFGLEAIEERAKDVRAFVETHEIRY
jgi:hypothetical protein